MDTFDAITKKRSTLSLPCYEKACKRGGIRKRADDCLRGREHRRSLIIRPDRDSSHHGHRCSNAKRGSASLPGANLVGGDIHDRLHAYALLNDDQPNITQRNAGQSLVRSKTPYDDDPYDAQDGALPSPLFYSSDTQSDTEVGENEKMVWDGDARRLPRRRTANKINSHFDTQWNRNARAGYLDGVVFSVQQQWR